MFFIKKLKKKLNILQELYNFSIIYKAPINLSYNWNFGSIAFVILLMQILTGIFLSMHYTPNIENAFKSIEHIMRDVNFGWLIRYIHLNGASFFFAIIYLHIFRNLYYNSFIKPRHYLWYSGVTIFFLMILTAFLGYVLPWGQMSYWAATVITNLVSTIPIIGTDIVFWIWGGYAVDEPTLNRFFSLHFLLPFILLFLVIIHFILLHETGSNNPLGLTTFEKIDKIPFHPYYTTKDLFGISISFTIFFLFVFFIPNYLGHTDNYIEANPCSTPAHIVPEWYFLPFYAILRSVPHKLAGVILLLLAIIMLYFLPSLNNNKTILSSKFRPILKLLNWFFAFNYIALGWIGSCPVEHPFYELGQKFTFFYFFYFYLYLLLNYNEKKILFSKLKKTNE